MLTMKGKNEKNVEEEYVSTFGTPSSVIEMQEAETPFRKFSLYDYSNYETRTSSSLVQIKKM